MYYIFLALIMLGGGRVQAQEKNDDVLNLVKQVETEVDNVNNMELRKVFLELWGYTLEGKASDWQDILYFDSDDILRKSIHNHYYFDNIIDSYCHRYYNIEGDVIYSLTGSRFPMDNSVSSIRYFDSKKNVIYIDHAEWDEDGPSMLLKHIIGEINQNSIKISRSDYIYNTQDLINYKLIDYSIDSLYAPIEYYAIKFGKPNKGDITFANENSVAVYTRPNIHSSIVGEVNIRDLLYIKKCKSGWVKIECSKANENVVYPNGIIGYIPASMLEPVERIVKVVKTEN